MAQSVDFIIGCFQSKADRLVKETMCPFEHQFFDHVLFRLASLGCHADIRTFHHPQGFHIVGTLPPDVDFHNNQALVVQRHGIDIRYDGRFTVVGNDIGNCIHVLEQCFVIHPDDSMVFIANSKDKTTSLAVGKCHNCLQKRDILLWPFKFELHILAFSFEQFFNLGHVV